MTATRLKPSKRLDFARLPGDFYVVHTYAGYEAKVKANLESRIQSMNMEDRIYDVIIPTEEASRSRAARSRPSSARSSPATSWSAWTSTTTPGTSSATPPPSPASSARPAPPRPALPQGGRGHPARARGGRGDGRAEGRLRGGREHPRHLRSLRRLHRDDLGDQRRPVEAQGARVHLRPRDARRARLRPGRQAVAPTAPWEDVLRTPASTTPNTREKHRWPRRSWP
jgi:transcription antitermination factor NusG